jgi:hypothetical protein
MTGAPDISAPLLQPAVFSEPAACWAGGARYLIEAASSSGRRVQQHHVDVEGSNLPLHVT